MCGTVLLMPNGITVIFVPSSPKSLLQFPFHMLRVHEEVENELILKAESPAIQP